MRISTYHRSQGHRPELVGPSATYDGRWQVRLDGDSSFAYVTAYEAQRLAEDWAKVAADIREREAQTAA